MSPREHVGQPTPDKDTIAQQLATAWLGEFQGLARTQAADKFKELFNPEAIIYGAEKGGVCDWPLVLQFTFDLENAVIVPAFPFILVLCDWSTQPVIVGGGVKRGHATFFLGVQEPKGKANGKVEAVHAHFSAIT